MHVFGACLNLSFNSINQSSRTSCGGVEPSGNAASFIYKVFFYYYFILKIIQE